MTDIPQEKPPDSRVGGGGAATSAGVRFQQQLGALFASWILAGDRFDERFALGDATPQWIRFETEAPVDDLLVKTSDDGFVAIQAKTTANLTDDPNSALAKTVAQFVRHWHACRRGDGTMEWNRPLDPSRDRLVLAVGPGASAQVRRNLPEALRLSAQPGGGALTQSQQRAFDTFTRLVEASWSKITREPLDRQLLPDLAKMVVVFTFDGDAGPGGAAPSLRKAFGPASDLLSAFSALVETSGKLMSERGGGDLAAWRNLVASRGVGLDSAPRYRTDIDALRRHSDRIAEALASYEKIEIVGGVPVTVERECQPVVEEAAMAGPLLIIGEPGAGKSGVLNALARSLRQSGNDVLELAVDRYSVESLEGLSRELGLSHGLLEVLEAWDGPEPAYLVIDALDATRGGRGEGVFRSLIERVLERRGRWKVVASIRNFDLRMGQQFRALFRGPPPVAALSDPSFSNVRHVQVPPWSDSEFEQLLLSSPELARRLASATPRLRELAMVPFNTRLLSELITRGILSGDLNKVASQADLLNLYWEHRVGGHGLPAMTSLRRVVDLMVANRALRAPRIEAAGDNPAMIDTLCKEGVLVVVDGDRWVQFRHHLLFDFAAARLLLEPSRIVSGDLRFPKASALGLMLAPALGFVLREIWESETDRARFWIGISVLIGDSDGDPVIRSTAGRLGAEFPTEAIDCIFLADRAIAGDQIAPKALSHVSGALAVRLEDEKVVPLAPWANLASRLSASPATVAGTLRFLLHNLIERLPDGDLRDSVGEASRALLAYGLQQSDPGFLVRSALGFVADTFATDPAVSRALLAQLFEPSRLARFGFEEVPSLCYKIEAFGDIDPDFIAEIFRAVFAYQVTEDRETRLGNSQILNLTSNARQDYDMAKWSLGEYLPKFLERHPDQAVQAVVYAADGFAVREHKVSEEALDVSMEVDGRVIRLREDHSYIWAHNPDDDYDRDAEALISKLRKHLKSASGPVAERIADLLIDKASLAVFWSRMFLSAVERADGLVDRLWPIAATEEFLVLPDTRKDAVDLVAAGAARRTEAERRALEIAAFQFDFSRFTYEEDARRALLERLFSAIGIENLVTEEARRMVQDKPEPDAATNKRLFVIESWGGVAEDLHWVEDLDREAPSNAAAIEAIKSAKALLQLEPGADDAPLAPFDESVAALETIERTLQAAEVHPGVRLHAEGVIGAGCSKIVSRKLLSSGDPPSPEQVARFITLMETAAKSANPELQDDTEAEFERSASWGGPAARIEAAEAYFDLIMQRPDLYPRLMPTAELLLTDRHPAVRLQAAVRIGGLWDVDRDAFWRLLRRRLAAETNLTVVEHVLGHLVSRLVHSDQERSLELLLALLSREVPTSDREIRVRKAVSDKLAILWVTYQNPKAKAVLDGWISAPAAYAEELRTVLATLRSAIVSGIDDPNSMDAGLRHRAQAFVSDVVDAANTRLAVLLNGTPLDEPSTAEARELLRLVDIAGNELFFSTGPASSQRENNPGLGYAGLDVFFRENADLLKRVGEFATPHTTYYLMQLVERLVDIDPASAFDVAASALQGGKRSGYENESLGADLLVRLIGVFLADHKEIFEDVDRRQALVDCLETFLEAGWPAARRLLYRLPELIQ